MINHAKKKQESNIALRMTWSKLMDEAFNWLEVYSIDDKACNAVVIINSKANFILDSD